MRTRVGLAVVGAGLLLVLAAQPRNVDSVWIDGVAKKRDGELVGIDSRELVRKAREAVAGLSARIEKPVV